MYFMLKHCPARALFVCHFISRAPKKTSTYQPWPQRPSITLHKVETSHPEPFTVDQIQSQSFQNHRDLAPGNFPLGIHLPTFDPDLKWPVATLHPIGPVLCLVRGYWNQSIGSEPSNTFANPFLSGEDESAHFNPVQWLSFENPEAEEERNIAIRDMETVWENSWI